MKVEIELEKHCISTAFTWHLLGYILVGVIRNGGPTSMFRSYDTGSDRLGSGDTEHNCLLSFRHLLSILVWVAFGLSQSLRATAYGNIF